MVGNVILKLVGWTVLVQFFDKEHAGHSALVVVEESPNLVVRCDEETVHHGEAGEFESPEPKNVVWDPAFAVEGVGVQDFTRVEVVEPDCKSQRTEV